MVLGWVLVKNLPFVIHVVTVQVFSARGDCDKDGHGKLKLKFLMACLFLCNPSESIIESLF